MARLRKGGPKRKDGPRDARGRLLPENDRGTTELLAKKLELTGSTFEEISSIGVLHGRRIIDDDMYEAATNFIRCYRAYIGNPDAQSGSFNRSARGNDNSDDSHLVAMKTRYWNCLAALQAIGPYVFNLVRDLCLFDRSGGLIGQVIALDIMRFDGTLVSRNSNSIPPDIRRQIGQLTRGLEAIDALPKADYSREARALLERLQNRSRGEEGARSVNGS